MMGGGGGGGRFAYSPPRHLRPKQSKNNKKTIGLKHGGESATKIRVSPTEKTEKQNDEEKKKKEVKLELEPGKKEKIKGKKNEILKEEREEEKDIKEKKNSYEYTEEYIEEEKKIHVDSIDVKYRVQNNKYIVTTEVVIKDMNNNSISNATVYMTITLPDKTKLQYDIKTGNQGIAGLFIQSWQKGVFSSVVMDVTHNEFEYDPDANIEDSKTCTVT